LIRSFRFFFLDFQRERPLILLVVVFGAAVVLLGRLQGVRSLVALALSFVILAVFTLPALLETGSPIGVAIAGSAAVAIVTLYLTHGVTHLSTVSLIGSLFSLSIMGLLAWIFGRDHIGSTTNTLVFAYAGAALPMLLLFTKAQLSRSTVLTSEIVAIEIVRALVGGIALVCSVPVTTALAVWAVRRGSVQRDPTEVVQ
jgi:uncharacterized membrane protein